MLVELFSEIIKVETDLSKLPNIRTWDWDVVLPLLHHHSLAARFYSILERQGLLEILPEQAKRSLLHATLHCAGTHALYHAYVSELIPELVSNGFFPVLLKGVSIANRFYKNPEQRPFHDLDLLFEESKRREVELFFIRKGFRKKDEGPVFEANLNKVEFELAKNSEVVVECHFGLGYGTYFISPDFKNLKKDRFGSWVLDIEDEYLYLVFHCAIQHRFQKLGWLLDLAQIHRTIQVPIEKLKDLASEKNLTRALDLTLYFLSRYAEVDGLGSYPKNIRADRWFSRIVEASIEDSKWRKAQIRAFTQGGWSNVIRYGVLRRRALNPGAKL